MPGGFTLTLTLAGIVSALGAVATLVGRGITWVLSKQLLAVMIIMMSLFLTLRSFLHAALARAGFNDASIPGLVSTGQDFGGHAFWIHDFISFVNYLFPLDHLFSAMQAYVAFLGALVIYKTICRHTPFLSA